MGLNYSLYPKSILTKGSWTKVSVTSPTLRSEIVELLSYNTKKKEPLKKLLVELRC